MLNKISFDWGIILGEMAIDWIIKMSPIIDQLIPYLQFMHMYTSAGNGDSSLVSELCHHHIIPESDPSFG